MQPSQLDILPPEQAAILIRKKLFWTSSLWTSGIIASVAALNILAFLILSKFDRVPELISENISLLVWIIGTGSAALLLLLISLIRCLSLPKLPKPVANADKKSTPHPTPPHDSH